MSETKESFVSVVLVGCGCPKRSMGWYHAMQILDQRVGGARLEHIVEPFYMSSSVSATASTNTDVQAFHAWREEVEGRGIVFHESVTTVPAPLSDEIRLVLFSARTADNPSLLHTYLQSQPSQHKQVIFLEKPGAPTVQQLQSIQEAAKKLHIPIYMGFNKNVSSYVQKARAMTTTTTTTTPAGGHYLTFVHNNRYAPDDLSECFERNAEGMLKNMAIHELALCVTYYGVTVESMAQVHVHKEHSLCETRIGPSTKQPFTDFRSLKFTLETVDGQKVSIVADRCGGDDSIAIVSDENGTEVARYTMPDESTVANIPHLQEKYGIDTMPYFFAQDPDYLRLKQLLVDHLLYGNSLEGVATIDVAIESMRMAEYLTPILQEKLL